MLYREGLKDRLKNCEKGCKDIAIYYCPGNTKGCKKPMNYCANCLEDGIHSSHKIMARDKLVPQQYNAVSSTISKIDVLYTVGLSKFEEYELIIAFLDNQAQRCEININESQRLLQRIEKLKALNAESRKLQDRIDKAE